MLILKLHVFKCTEYCKNILQSAEEGHSLLTKLWLQEYNSARPVTRNVCSNLSRNIIMQMRRNMIGVATFMKVTNS
jgi:hypothetical protein